ncbi:MAG: ROK family protein, partial [Halanaerobiales bacterium]
PVFLTVSPTRSYIISVGIEVNHIRIMIFDLKLNVKNNLILTLEERSPEKIILDLIDKIKEFCKDSGISVDRVIGMGIALPGLINDEQGLLYFAPNLEWRNIEIKEYFKREFEFPVLIENEAKAAVLGEREFIYPEADNLVFVSINEGIGCGIIFDGNLYRGASMNAGEFGHIRIDSDGPRCHCGNKGCWETLASLNYIVYMYQQETGQKIVPDQVTDLLLSGDKTLISIIKSTARNIAVGLVNIINSLSPEMLVIGGDIIEYREYMMETIDDILAERTLDVLYENTNIVYSQLGNNASLFGIARMVFDNNIEEQIFEVV